MKTDPTANPRGPAGMITAATFGAACLAAIGVVASCETRAKSSGECLPAYGAALGLVITGAAPMATFEVGFQRVNPALDPLRKAELLADLPVAAGPAPLPPLTPDWFAVPDAEPTPEPDPTPEPVLDPRLAFSDDNEDPDTAAARMARAAARLPRRHTT
jgi:hypothetical protein